MVETNEAESICLSKEQYSVYSCICYFHIFRYPVKLAEVAEYLNIRLPVKELSQTLDELTEIGALFRNDEFYFLTEGYDAHIAKRLSSEKRFLRKQKLITRFARFISRFPFVESVAISGSCSKGLLDEDGDVDYFVITSPGKLWLCRTILMLFKKIFLLNSKKYFCLNYFVDSQSLEIPDKNIFVANEIKSLVPISNKAVFEKFLLANGWTSEFLPNWTKYNSTFLEVQKPAKYFFRIVELIFDSRLGLVLDNFFFRLTLNTWKKRFLKKEGPDFDLNFRSKKNVSKHHPRGFQKKVLFELKRKLDRVKVLG